MKSRNCVVSSVALATVLGAAMPSTPAHAQADVETLTRTVERLMQRVEQLEAANKRLEARVNGEAAASPAAPARTPEAKVERAGSEQATDQRVVELGERLDDVENQVVALKKPSKLQEALEGVHVEASLLGVGQRLVRGDTTGGQDSQLNYRADLSVEVPMGSFGALGDVGDSRLFVHFRAGQGGGLTQPQLPPTLTATPNSTAFFLANGDDATFILAQAWYQIGLPLTPTTSGKLPRVEGTFGKIDVFGFFDQNAIADDESAAFLNNVFVHNPLLDSGGAIGADSYGFQPGVIGSYTSDVNSVDRWKASLGVFGAGPGAGFDTSFSRPFVIGQWAYSGRTLQNRPGNYRLYAWTNGSFVPYNNESATTTGRESGFGFSIDQEVARHVTLFARYGHSFSGQVRFDNAVTLGGQLGGAGWRRAQDKLGLAVGWLNTSKGFRAAAPTLDANGDGVPDFDYVPSGAEKDVELYYVWSINEHLQLSPSYQAIVQPGGDSNAKNVQVISLRARAAF